MALPDPSQTAREDKAGSGPASGLYGVSRGSSFALALPYVLKHEGGWSDDPDDPGGATNKGITLATANAHGIQTVDELRHITDEQVASIYRSGYWRFDRILSQRVATKLLDMAVNMGLRTAIRLVQEALNDLGAGLNVDGVMGPLAVSAINQIHEDSMLLLLCEVSKRRYLDIVAARPKSKKFLDGWLKRASEVPE